MANPKIANQNRRRAAPEPVFELVVTMEDQRRFLIRVSVMNDVGD